MRISNAALTRDMRSFQLALRMLSHEARPHTVSVWTGLSTDRVGKLSMLQRRDGPQRGAPRHRGPTPTQLAAVLTSPSLRSEAAAVAGLCQVLGVIPVQPVANARTSLPSVPRGELVCTALELFQQLIPHARLNFDQWVLLLLSLAEGGQWGMARCRGCHALLVADRLALESPLCDYCQHDERIKKSLAPDSKRARALAPESSKPDKEREPGGGVQLSLFDVPYKNASD
jgi:hypothetical protein